MQLHHVALQVTNLDVARAFYVDVLGLTLLRTQPHSLWVQAGPSIVMLELCSGAHDESAWKSDRVGPFVVAFGISAAEREPLRARLAAAGVEVQHETGFTMYVRDPFGARIAFSHYPEVR